jgi:DNA-binding transcriptional LysR family regulator
MELRQLRYFVAVAEELHFSRAASRLHLAQSALSAHVRRLENEVGGPLFIRTTRRVALTPAGEALLADAREVLAAADDALRRARARARGETGAIVIGSLGPASGGLLAPALAMFGGRHPSVRVEVRAFDFTDTVNALRERRADVAFVYLPLDVPDIVTTALLEEPRVVVLPRGHVLATRRELKPADLADEAFVTHPPAVPAAWRNFWILADELDRAPRTSPRLADKVEDWLLMIARGEGIDTCPAIISRYYPWPDLAYVPLVDAPPATLVLARRADVRDRLVEDFVACAQAAATTDAASLHRL